MVQKITTRIAEISYLDSRILRVEFPTDVYVELEDTIQIHEACEALTKGQKYLKLVVANGILISSKAARSYRATLKESDGRIAEALIYKSHGNKIVFNFYITLHTPKVPTKLFSTEEKAIEWLKNFMYVTESAELTIPFRKSKSLI
ncbi:MAG: hypothetical protein H0W84_06975 [Bacteroidetes bacterium]|nr:hypothetical protein [Bacteroidota bacterium]